MAGCIQMNQLLFRTFPVFVCPNSFDDDANSSNDVSDSADGRSGDVTASTMTTLLIIIVIMMKKKKMM